MIIQLIPQFISAEEILATIDEVFLYRKKREIFWRHFEYISKLVATNLLVTERVG